MKIFTIIAAVALTASVSSCAKVHTCTCTTTSTVVGSTPDITTDTFVTGPKAMYPSKRSAKLSCEEVGPASYLDNDVISQTCEFK